jgi:rfaE bifunctional protein nucleotidyltransferase chain/domain
MGEVVVHADVLKIRARLKHEGKKIVFTNGVFDIVHRGHVEYLTKAKALGDVLFVGMNTDASVQRLKGPQRPVVPQDDRAFVLAALRVVDEDTPYNLIKAVVPDVLVKGSDWAIDSIVGKDIVEAAGGKVQTIDYVPNRSTTNIIQKIATSGKQ